METFGLTNWEVDVLQEEIAYKLNNEIHSPKTHFKLMELYKKLGNMKIYVAGEEE